MKKITFILFALLMTFVLQAALTDHWKITLGNDTFCVPKRHSTLDQTSGPLFDIPGTDVGPEGGTVQVIIEPEEIQKEIPEYTLNDGDMPAHFLIHLELAPEQKPSRILNRNLYRAALQLSEGYPEDFSNAHIQFDEKNRYYRVSNDISPGPFAFWKVLKVKPGKQVAVPAHLDDYFVASCSSLAGSPVGDENSGADCKYHTAIDDYLVQIGTTENNLLLKDKITAYAKRLLGTWRQDCQ